MIIAGLSTYYLTCLFMILYRDFKAWREGDDSHSGTRLEMEVLRNSLSLSKHHRLSPRELISGKVSKRIKQLRWWRIDQWVFIRRRWLKSKEG